MDDQINETATQSTPPTSRRRFRGGWRIALGIAALGLVAVMVVSSLTIAFGQTPTPTPTEDEKPGLGHGKRFGHRGHGFGGIHGEFVTRNPSGEGFQTLATQVGVVNAVSSSSIEVKSEDGFTRSYKVDDNTLVNAGNDGIADVKKDDNVRIIAVVEDGDARAVSILDATRVGELKGRWRPGRERPSEERTPEEGSSQTSA